jgi:hypothetical protein
LLFFTHRFENRPFSLRCVSGYQPNPKIRGNILVSFKSVGMDPLWFTASRFRP